MRRSRQSTARTLAITLRPLISRAGIILLLCASLGLVVMGRNHGPLTQNLRAAISDTVVPVIDVLAKPVDAIASVGHWVSDTVAMREENKRLKSDNTRLLQWQAVATELSSENDKLRALLKFAPASKEAFTSARVAADTGSPYSRSVIITSGSNQGVSADLAVVNEAGLVGRIVDVVGKKTSRVLLLTDINSRIPVISEESRERAIAGGNNSDMLSLIYLGENSKLKVGEKIITSGDGGVLPPGLPVGVVTKIEKGAATVKPFMDGYRLDFVTVVDFAM